MDKIKKLTKEALLKGIDSIDKRGALALQRYYNFTQPIKWNRCNCHSKQWREIFRLVIALDDPFIKSILRDIDNETTT